MDSLASEKISSTQRTGPANLSVVLICQALVTGGAQRQVVQLARTLHSNGVRACVVTFYDGGELVGDLKRSGVPHISLAKKGRWDLFGFLWRLVATLRRLDPDVIYGFMAVVDVLLVLLRPLLPRQAAVVWGVRSSNLKSEHYDWLLRLFLKIESALSRKADLIISNSISGRDDVVARGFPTERVIVIPNGIDTGTFRYDSEGRERLRAEWKVGRDEVLVGLPARLDPMKGHETFIRAAAEVVRRSPRARFVCVGDGPVAVRRRLHALARQIGLDRELIWAGSRTDMPAAYSAMDIVVSSSSFGEGFSNSIGEAMACARPCVVSDVGDSRKVVGESGVVVRADDPAGLAAAIGLLIDGDRKAMEAAARERAVNEFGVRAMVDRTVDAFVRTRASRLL